MKALQIAFLAFLAGVYVAPFPVDVFLAFGFGAALVRMVLS